MSGQPHTGLLQPQAAAAARRSTGPAAAWLREPLLHFVLLGGLLFGADHWLVGRQDDPRRIVVDAAVDAEARQTFQATRGRAPSADELAALRRIWLDNEVLYRHGLALQVDKGDSAIRERVIFKALSVVDANTKLPPLDDAVLRSWFAQHRTQYDEPARFDFQEAVLGAEATEPALRAFVDALNSGLPGDARAGLRVFKGRPQANLVDSYGPEFTQALQNAPPGEWRTQPSKSGLRAVRLDAVAPARAATFEALRGVLLQDWTDATMALRRTAAVRALQKNYTISTEAAAK